MRARSVRKWVARSVGVATIATLFVGVGTTQALGAPDDESSTDGRSAEVAGVLVDALGSIGRSNALQDLGAPIAEVASCLVGNSTDGGESAALVTSCSAPIAAIDPSIALRLLSALDFDRLLNALTGSGQDGFQSGRSSRYVMPASGKLTSPFGDGRNHQGIDIAAPMGSPIRAVADGEVISAGPASGFGLWVRIRHDDGTITTYGHNNTNLVSVGDRVQAGQKIATVGNRGESSGPHLHFEVESPSGEKLDPEEWLFT